MTELNLGTELFGGDPTQLTYEETAELVESMSKLPNLSQPDTITQLGRLMVRIIATNADKKYVEENYESAPNKTVARYYFSSTDSDLIKTYLVMRWSLESSPI